MPDFKKSKIYQICSRNNTNLKYIGNTTLELHDRLIKHKSRYKRWIEGGKTGKYCTSYRVLACKDYYIELIKNIPCANLNAVHKEEKKYIRSRPCVNIEFKKK
jgi:hypothetical protein